MFNYPAMAFTLVFIIFDCMTGFIQALANKNLSSSKMREGVKHKGAFVLVVVLAVLCEYAMSYVPDLGFDVPLVTPVCVYLIITEIVSIFENIGKMNSDILNNKLFQLFAIADKRRRITDTEEENGDTERN